MVALVEVAEGKINKRKLKEGSTTKNQNKMIRTRPCAKALAKREWSVSEVSHFGAKQDGEMLRNGAANLWPQLY